jgi:hypothetical protein
MDAACTDVIKIHWLFRKIIKLDVSRYPDDGDIVFGFVIAQAIATPNRVVPKNSGRATPMML